MKLLSGKCIRLFLNNHVDGLIRPSVRYIPYYIIPRKALCRLLISYSAQSTDFFVIIKVKG